MRALLVIAGLVSIVLAAFLVYTPAGFAALGGALILTALTTPARPAKE